MEQQNSAIDAGDPPRPEAVDTAFLRRFTESIDSYLAFHNHDEVSTLLDNLVSAIDGEQAGGRTALTVRQTDSLEAALSEGELHYFTLTGRPVQGAVVIDAADGERYLLASPGDLAEATEFIDQKRRRIDQLLAQRDEMADQITEALSNPEITAVLEERQAQRDSVAKDRFEARTTVRGANGSVVLAVAADAREELYYLDGQATEGEALAGAIQSTLERYDPAEERARVLDTLERELESALSAGGLDDYLEARQIEVGELRQEEGRMIRRVFYRDDEIGQFILSSEEATVTLEGLYPGEGVPMLEEWSEAIGGGGGHPSGTTFLLLGTNRGLADAIVLLQATSSTLSLLSIPRDLYVEDRKLSELHLALGPARFSEVLGEAVGVPIDHYLTMSVAGFEEVVAEFGGVEVTLREEILDPSMIHETEEGERMLFFAPGEHRVGPGAANALVRSRATTSDYSRSDRQRAVIAGLRREVASLTLTDADRVFALIETVVRNAQTDVSVGRLTGYYRRFRGAGAIREHGLSEDNVLTSTYTAIFHGEVEDQQEAEENGEELGGWILRPTNDDWDLLRWYVGSWFAGRTPAIEEYPGWDEVLPMIPSREDEYLPQELSTPSMEVETTGTDGAD